MDQSKHLGISMKGISLGLVLIAFLATAQCQECYPLDNLSIYLKSVDTKCGEIAQFCPGSDLTALRMDTFQIDIENKGKEPINHLILNAIIPKDMKYINYSYIERGGGMLEERINPQEFDGMQNTSIKWYIGDLGVGEIRSILFRTYLDCSTKRTQIELEASGYISEICINSPKIELINLTECNCTSDSTICAKETISEDIDVSACVYEANNNANAFFGSYSVPAKLNIYNITITNGDLPQDGVQLTASLNKNMTFRNSAYSDPRRGRLNVEIYPTAYEGPIVIWNLGNMLSKEARSIILEAYIKKDGAYDTNISLVVSNLTDMLGEPMTAIPKC